MKGLEYLNADTLAGWWDALDAAARSAAHAHSGGLDGYLREVSPLWRAVGRITFHLAENKRDPDRPFAFLATYARRLSAQARVLHQPLGAALREYGSAKDKQRLIALLTPIERAADKCAWVKALVDSGAIFRPLSWSPAEAYQFLRELPLLEASGLLVRVPNWWNAHRPPRPTVNVTIGNAKASALGLDALLDFHVGVALGGQSLTATEIKALLAGSNGLVLLKGQWVEVDKEKLQAALDHWSIARAAARDGEVTFLEAMRMLSGVKLSTSVAADDPAAAAEWSQVAAGQWLGQTLDRIRAMEDGQAEGLVEIPCFTATLRPYQHVGVRWLEFMVQLGLGACLADDMGLGKTVQVLGLLLKLRQWSGIADDQRRGLVQGTPSLLVVPASLLGNWKAEIAKFSPDLRCLVTHPSETDETQWTGPAMADHELIITTYGMLTRVEALRRQSWNLVILDEAQAIKNSGTRQTRAVKQLVCRGRIALTGTPIENRLSDLWSLFDFLNPGLLGSADAFGKAVKRMAADQDGGYGPLRTLIRPYLLRRLKTDKRIIADLPEKTEVPAYCALSKRQAALYAEAVDNLKTQLTQVGGIQRRGIVLAYLMRFKQICNHPSQWLGDNAYQPADSGKFARLAEICAELAERQERALVFTQFREMTGPLADFLAGVFGRPGLVLHGQIPVGKRRKLIETFQREDGPPFFVLSLKAGGTGLNLTAASQVIHFDRWWNPAVENQATDRAFRIGQKKNVLVHKFVCRGTLEERIDQMLADKRSLSSEVLEGGAEKLLTEMNNDELLHFVSLDIQHAADLM
jgi:non-specific serine/threonine protein kinase